MERVPTGASVLLYYAGHAVQVAGENYLIPTGARAAEPGGWLPQFVPLSELFDVSNRARAGFQLRDCSALSVFGDAAILDGRTLHVQMLDSDAGFLSGENVSYLT